MTKYLSALVLTSISFATYASQEKCTLLECHTLSRAEIREIREQGIKERFKEDPENINAFKKLHAEKTWLNQDFETWYGQELNYYVESFSHSLDWTEKRISEAEKRHEITVGDQTRFEQSKSGLDVAELLKDKGACLLAKEKGKKEKSCRSHRSSCAGAVLFIFTMGNFGSRGCSPAYSYCRYHRNYDLLLKTNANGKESIQPLSLQAEGEYSEGKHHNFMFGMASKAKKTFKAQENKIKELIKNLPDCNE